MEKFRSSISSFLCDLNRRNLAEAVEVLTDALEDSVGKGYLGHLEECVLLNKDNEKDGLGRVDCCYCVAKKALDKVWGEV